MELNKTPRGSRFQIGVFGKRNVGKSSLVNLLTNSNMSLVSDVAGTTTDVVEKNMEILPIGPVTFLDTAGIDDIGELGLKRVQKTFEALEKCDLAIFVCEPKSFGDDDIENYKKISKKVPTIIVVNKWVGGNEKAFKKLFNSEIVFANVKTKMGLSKIFEEIKKVAQYEEKEITLFKNFVNANDIVVLVTPIDSSAPKDRLILPQQQAVRDLLDKHAICMACQVEQLEILLKRVTPKLVVTDSQAFAKVAEIVPDTINLTSFSMLFARKKCDIQELVFGANKIDSLQDGNNVLISEGCTHLCQSEDIGKVQIPKLLKEKTGKKLNFVWTSGNSFDDDLQKYSLVIHCGGCMLNRKQMLSRMNDSLSKNVPITNYGVALAKLNGILDRASKLFKI